MVLYRPSANFLLWIDRSFTQTDEQELKLLHAVANGQASVPINGDAVFERLQTIVLEQPERVAAALAEGLMKYGE
jgi:hypothetical protein